MASDPFKRKEGAPAEPVSPDIFGPYSPSALPVQQKPMVKDKTRKQAEKMGKVYDS